MVTLILLLTVTNAQKIYSEFIEKHGHGGLLPDDVVCQDPFDMISTRLINGRDAQGNWPFVVRLEMYPNEKRRNEYYQCGGSIINWNWVLTAAHCLENIELADIVYGKRVKGQVKYNKSRVSSRKFFVHPHYSTSDRRQNDVALIYVPEGLPDNGHIRPICLTDRRPKRRERCYVAGWGTTEVNSSNYSTTLQEAMVPMMDVRACGRPDSYGSSFDDETMICAGYWIGQTDTCIGDSGGPLVCIDERLQPHVAGIISWGKGCAKAHYPGVYTRVGSFMQWIKQTIIQNTDVVGDGVQTDNIEAKAMAIATKGDKKPPVPINELASSQTEQFNEMSQAIVAEPAMVTPAAKTTSSPAGKVHAILPTMLTRSTILPSLVSTATSAIPDMFTVFATSTRIPFEPTSEQTARFDEDSFDDGFEDGIVQNDSLRTEGLNEMREKLFALRESAMTDCGNLFDRFKISLNVEINCDHRRCRFTCEDPNYRPTLKNAFCKNSKKDRWSPRYRNEKIECVARSQGTLCGSVQKTFAIDVLAVPSCKLSLCKFDCPHGTEPSHPKGIRCKRPRLELWSEPRGTLVQCYKADLGFSDYTEKCGRLRDHPKMSWIGDIKNLNVQCDRKRRLAQTCNFSCSNGRPLSGTSSVTCHRNETGIFLTDVEKQPSCK